MEQAMITFKKGGSPQPITEAPPAPPVKKIKNKKETKVTVAKKSQVAPPVLEISAQVAEEGTSWPVYNLVDAEVSSAKAQTTVKTATGAEKKKEETLFKVVSTTPLANIGFKAGQTINLGNYESVKIEVSLHLPCKIEDIDDTYKFASGWVDNKMGEVQAEYKQLKESK